MSLKTNKSKYFQSETNMVILARNCIKKKTKSIG